MLEIERERKREGDSDLGQEMSGVRTGKEYLNRLGRWRLVVKINVGEEMNEWEKEKKVNVIGFV